MKIDRRALIGGALVVGACAATGKPAAMAGIPREWTDPDTGRRIVRLSSEAGTRSLYFYRNSYSPDGRLMVMNGPSGIFTVDLETRAERLLVPGRIALFTGRRTRTVYFMKRDGEGAADVLQPTEICGADLDTGEVRTIGTIPSGFIASINADETLMVGVSAERAWELQTGPRDPRFDANYQAMGPDGKPLNFQDSKEVRMDARLQARIPMKLFVMEVTTGEVKVIHEATDWLNHAQFSPTDPGQIIFCHEGPWHKVDRMWAIRSDGTDLRKLHTRTMNMEIAGHEFFGADGRTVWYDVQRPRGEDFWLASVNLDTGARIWRRVARNDWSVHYNMSPDGRLLAGDGGDAEMVARAADGKWIYLFRERLINDVAGLSAPDAGQLIRPAILESEKLVNMSGHDYRLEPNLRFSPDSRSIIFRGNWGGEAHVYAVEVDKR